MLFEVRSLFEVLGYITCSSQVDKDDEGQHLVVPDENHSIHHLSFTHQKSQETQGYAKSLRYYLTREVLPSESNYRNLLSFGRQLSKPGRPTLDQLREDVSEKDLNRNRIKKVII